MNASLLPSNALVTEHLLVSFVALVSLVPLVALPSLGDRVCFGVGDVVGVGVRLLRLPHSLRAITRSTMSFLHGSDFATLAHLSVRRHDTLIGVFCSALHGSELASLCYQLSLDRRHAIKWHSAVGWPMS